MRGIPGNEANANEPTHNRLSRSAGNSTRGSPSRHPRPTELATEALPICEPHVEDQRRALRNFMVSNALSPTRWAELAAIPVSEIFAFLNRKAPAISPETLEKLARVVRAKPSDLLSG